MIECLIYLLFHFGCLLLIFVIIAICAYIDWLRNKPKTQSTDRARVKHTENQAQSSPIIQPPSEDLAHSVASPLSEFGSKKSEPPLANHEIMQEVLSLHTPLDQKVIKMLQNGASLEDIKERFGPEVAATADATLAKMRDQLSERLYPLVAAGLTMEDLISESLVSDDLIEKLGSTATTQPLPSDQLPDKAPEFPPIGSEPEELFIEGATRQVTSSVYERDPRARRACLAHHGLKCVVCGLDFAEAYGELGEGFIHVHHLRPLSEIAGEYEVNPITDLVPVCPNCHAMLHRRNPPLSPDELRKIRLG